MLEKIKKTIGDFLDYNYYRVSRFYFKREGSSAITAVIHVCLILLFSAAPFLILLLIFIYDKFEIQKGDGIWVVRIIVIILFLLTYFLVSHRYGRKNIYMKLRDRWYGETKRTKVVKGIGVILSVLVPLSISILMVTFREQIRTFLH
ncbi:hypothetical protein B0I18_1079 [Taibaiella chishuiensis]|uniref:Uncharacterized protein n=1 Tax=Taibaiella chishuiensis TaxID=1434707 RepID=A0A2P8D057_9BACT|nr:hypothetical protein B0I18_1079 [Taibaiella chishuiensis]